MRPLPLLFAASVLHFLAGAPSDASPIAPQKRAIVRSLTRELGHATAGHVKISAWKLTDLKIDGSWALAEVQPADKRHLDAFTALLRQTRKGWKVVTLGTSLRGAGQQFHAPQRLWRKWNL